MFQLCETGWANYAAKMNKATQQGVQVAYESMNEMRDELHMFLKRLLEFQISAIQSVKDHFSEQCVKYRFICPIQYAILLS